MPWSSRLNVGIMVLAVALVAVRSSSLGGDGPSMTSKQPSVRSGDPVFEFNGKDLEGFTTYLRFKKHADPDHVFTVHDGMIHVTGEEVGGFTTRDSFSNYHLIAEWKWGYRTWYPRRWRARNSGIMVHCSGLEGSALDFCMASIECQIIEGGTGDLIVVPAKGQKPPELSAEVRFGADRQPYYQKGGERITRQGGRINWWGRDPEWNDVLWFRGRQDVDKPFGEWNRMEVICEGDRITCLLNGQVVNVGLNSSVSSGKIMFQSEGAEIFFRRIEVRPLIK